MDANVVSLCRLRQQANMLESGEMRTRERRAGAGLVDTTADTLEHVERNFAGIEALLARHRESQVELKAPRR